MGIAAPQDCPVGPAHRWVHLYNRYVFLVLALREFTRKGWPAGCLQDAVGEVASAAADAADRLREMGYDPAARFDGEEARLWARTLQYVAGLSHPAGADGPAGWDRLVAVVWGLSDAFFAALPALQPGALRPEGLAVLVGERAPHPAAVDLFGESAGEVADQPVIRGSV